MTSHGAIVCGSLILLMAGGVVASTRQSSAELADRPALSLVRPVVPIYPAIAAAARIQGVVIVEFSVEADGRATDWRVLRSVKLLEEAALDAVRQWRFEPPVQRRSGVRAVFNYTLAVAPWYPGPATYRDAPPSWVPDNFAFRYEYACRSAAVVIDTVERRVTTRRNAGVHTTSFAFEREQAAAAYLLLVEAGIFNPDRVDKEILKEVPPAVSGIQSVGEEIRVNVAQLYEFPEVVMVRQVQWVGGDRPTHVWGHRLAVRRGDTWTRLRWSEPLERSDKKDMRRLREAGTRLRKLVKENLGRAARQDCV